MATLGLDAAVAGRGATVDATAAIDATAAMMASSASTTARSSHARECLLWVRARFKKSPLSVRSAPATAAASLPNGLRRWWQVIRATSTALSQLSEHRFDGWHVLRFAHAIEAMFE
jgi:hypothetical protein